MNKIIGTSLSYAVKLYQVSLSSILGGRCRFYPSCSEYARQSFIRYGAVKGLFRSTWRILRCNPWNHGGYDPS